MNSFVCTIRLNYFLLVKRVLLLFWYYYLGFAIVNVVLLWATWLMWGWLKPQKMEPLRTLGGTEE